MLFHFGPDFLNHLRPIMETPLQGGEGIDERIHRITPVLYWFLLVPFVPLVIYAIRRVYMSTIVKRQRQSRYKEMLLQADEYTKAGRFTSAAIIYEEKLNMPDRAAPLFEKGGDLVRAANGYEACGQREQAMRLYEEAGEFGAAAELAQSLGKNDEAASLYGRAGRHLESAVCLERAGRKMASAKEYRAAGEYKKASGLLEELGMPGEAAEMYSISIRNIKIERSTLAEFYKYAALLEKAGQPEKALSVFNEISAADPEYRDVSGRIEALDSAADKSKDNAQDTDEMAVNENPAAKEKERTLRDVTAGRALPPKEAVRIWVQVLKALKEYQKKNGPHLRLSPVCIFSVEDGFEVRKAEGVCAAIYEDPEGPNPYSDMYSMGVMLFEMLTGDISGFTPEGIRNTLPSAANAEVPPVLDGVFSVCVAPPARRLKNADEALAALKSASRGK